MTCIDLIFSSPATRFRRVATARTRRCFRPLLYVGVNAGILHVKCLDCRPEAFRIRADGFRLAQCEMDCRYDSGGCAPICVSENGFDVNDELGEEKLPANRNGTFVQMPSKERPSNM